MTGLQADSKTSLLLLRFEGPLQSWGERSRWDLRDSADEPTKSGVIGLIGCAMGLKVGDPRLEELDAALALGVRVERAGRRLVDFHTVTGVLPTADGKRKGKHEEPATIVSRRTYLEDAAFLVVIGGPDPLLRTIANAIRDPRWPVFLGRKSCIPCRPVFESLTDSYASVEDALRRHPWSCEARESEDAVPGGPLDCTVEDPGGPAERRDRIRVNPARNYATRRVRRFRTAAPLKTEGGSCI